MKLLPAAVTLACAALLISCGRQQADNTEIEKQAQDRLAEEHQAQEERQLHEREAALDEQQRVLDERAQQLAAASSAPSVPSVPSAVPTPQPPSPDASYQAFYDYLSPYGSWIEMPGYGYVWQPMATVQDGRWRPYTIGRWAYTDDGWTWISDEPFGWITYHYGRWMRTRTLNWVWFPGDQWAPAWVSWRFGNDFAGWAPLPPEARFDGATGIRQWADQQYNLGASDYIFVPAAEFGDESMADEAVPPDQEGPIYDESNNITNIYSDGGAIICYGLNYDFMRSRSRLPLRPQLSLRRAGFRAGGNNGAVISGNILEVAAPRILGTPAAPKTIRGRVADTRLVAPSSTPPPPGAVIPPLYQPPRVANSSIDAQLPSQTAPAPPSTDIDEQRARDLQTVQEQEAELDRQRREAARAEHAAAEEQSKAAREEIARAQAARQIQPSSVPASTQPAGQGR